MWRVNGIKQLLCLVAATVLPLFACAQTQSASLPTLKDDLPVKKGKLANGINWYFASNPSQKGLMNLSLVQKTDHNLSEEELEALAGQYFSMVDVVPGSFQSFLSRNGISPSADGWFSVQRGSVHYNIDNLSSAMPEAVVDSTLLAVLCLASKMNGEGAPSQSQAIFISGDFDQNAMLGKLKLLSLIAHGTPGEVPVADYDSNQSGRSDSGLEVIRGEGLSSIKVVWNEARTPMEYIRTVLPVVSDKLAGEFGHMLTNHLDKVFVQSGIKAWCEFSHTGSLRSPYAESLVLTVNCLSSVTDQVCEMVQTELSRLYTWGVNEVEYSYLEDACKYAWIKKSKNPMVSNEWLQECCKASFLYGAPLTGEAEKVKFAYRPMEATVKTRLFNDYMGKLLDQVASADSTLAKKSVLTSRSVVEQSLDSYVPDIVMKAPKDKDEYITGGVQWNFSNGVNVIFKKMKTDGLTYFCYAAKGGRQYADEDNFKTISGIHQDVFSNYLAAMGIDLDVKLQASDVRLEGNVVDENLEQMLKILVALSSQESNDKVFGPNNYKLLVLVTDRNPEEIRSMASRYVYGLRPGSRWHTAGEVDASRELYRDTRGFVYKEVVFPFDRSVINAVVADVSSYALKAALAMEFDGCGLYGDVYYEFLGYPVGDFRLVYGVRQLPKGSWHQDTGTPGEREINYRLMKVLRSLESGGITPAQLAEYKGRAKNARLSLANTAQYYVQLAADRYLDNKDMSRYPSRVESVTAAQINAFYAAAAASD